MDLLGQCSTDIIYVSHFEIKIPALKREKKLLTVRFVLCDAIEASIILEEVS